ncbi:MAG: hypothetical protein JXR03_15445 [Cyclobacteriaceae bacterium]
MKKKQYRYFLYLGIGVILYFALERKDGGESLDKFHDKAPAIILIVVVLLLVLNFIKSRREKKK